MTTGRRGPARNEATKGDRVFAGWGSWVARFRWPVLAVALAAVIGGGSWGLGVFGQLSEGGYNDPNGESTRAGQIVQQTVGAQGGDLVAIYTPANGTIDDAALGKRIRARLAELPKSAVASTASYWQQKSAQYAAKNKSSAVAVITLIGSDDAARLKSYRQIDGDFAVPGATVELAGSTVLSDASSARSTSDLGTAEMISLPITLALLVFLFGSVVAASLPVLVGGASVLGSLGILHAVASHHQVNSFAVNVASLLGLGMAIDYGLFTVGRFREEQAQGRTPAEAVRRTVGTAGRTVVFSATLLMIALAGLLLFPQEFLKSLAYGGLAAVALAATLSLTLLPALLAILGPRVDKLPVRLPRRADPGPAGSSWSRLADLVLRRPVLVAVPILAGLLVLAAPIAGVHFGETDERMLPAGDPARVALETLKADYPQFAGNAVQIVLRGAQDTGAFAAAARRVPGIAEIGAAQRTDAGIIFTAKLSSDDPYSASARDAVDGIRALPLPAGAQLLVGGATARNLDSLHATAAKLPLMVAMLAGATLLLMFLAFGSLVLPIKAVVMSALSLSATFGVLVWIFEDGHGAGLLDVTPAPLEVGIVVLMAAVVFGLSTDYEVFLLSRMVEARVRGASSAEAVKTGLARTGRVISAAAVLLIVVTGAFAISSVTTMRFVGVGMIVALLLDATVVRLLLVPAVLGLLGDAAWWAPGPLRRLQQRAGLAEHAGEETAAAEAAASGRHAAPDDTAVLTGIVGYAPFLPEGPIALPAGPSASDPAFGSTAFGSAAFGFEPFGFEAADSVAFGSPAEGVVDAGFVAVGEVLGRDEAPGQALPGGHDKPSWARPSGAVPALPAPAAPFALPAGPADETEVFPVYPGETAGLNTVRIQLASDPEFAEPAGSATAPGEPPTVTPVSAASSSAAALFAVAEFGPTELPAGAGEAGAEEELPVYDGRTAGLDTLRIPLPGDPAETAAQEELPVYDGQTAGLDTLRILLPAGDADAPAEPETDAQRVAAGPATRDDPDLPAGDRPVEELPAFIAADPLIPFEAGADSYAALFPELFGGGEAPGDPVPAWSPAPDPFGYRHPEPAADERYVVPTLADQTGEIRVGTAAWTPVTEPDAAPSPPPAFAEAALDLQAEPGFRPLAGPDLRSFAEPDFRPFAEPDRRPADLSTATDAWRRTPAEPPPARPADLAGYVERPAPADLASHPERPAPAGASGHAELPDTPSGAATPTGRPTDLGSYAYGRPVGRRPEDGAGPAKASLPGEATLGWRPPELGRREVRPADLGQYSQASQRPASDDRSRRPGGPVSGPHHHPSRPERPGASPEESARPAHLGDHLPQVRRPASLADHLPPGRSGRDGDDADPTRDLFEHGETRT